MVLPKISENLNIPRKPLALWTCAARCLFLYLSTNSVAAGVFISARVSEFWLFSLHHFHECLQLSKWRQLRSKELALNFVWHHVCKSQATNTKNTHVLKSAVMFLFLIIYNSFRMDAKIFKGKNRLIPLMHTFYVREFKAHVLRYNERHKKKVMCSDTIICTQ